MRSMVILVMAVVLSGFPSEAIGGDSFAQLPAPRIVNATVDLENLRIRITGQHFGNDLPTVTVEDLSVTIYSASDTDLEVELPASIVTTPGVYSVIVVRSDGEYASLHLPVGLLPGPCQSGEVAKWSGTAWTCATDNELESGGVTTTSGRIDAFPDPDKNVRLDVDSMGAYWGSWSNTSFGLITNGARRLYMDNVGRVGIGTTDLATLSPGSMRVGADLFVDQGIGVVGNASVGSSSDVNGFTYSDGTHALLAPGSLKVQSQLLVAGAGPHSIGGPSDGQSQLTVTGVSGFHHGIRVTSTLAPTANAPAALLEVRGAIQRASSGEHADFMTAVLYPPTVAAGSTPVRLASTLKIVGDPSFADTNYGFWNQGSTRLDGDLKFVVPGSRILLSDGSPSAPSIAFFNGGGQGFFRLGSDVTGYADNGAERLRIANGNLAIGTTVADQRLVVGGKIKLTTGASGILFSDGTLQTTASAGGDITSVTTAAGSGLLGGSTSGAVALQIDATVVPRLGASSTFTAAQAVNVTSANAAFSASQGGTGTALYGLGTATSGMNYGVFGATDSAAGYAGYFSGPVEMSERVVAAGGFVTRIDHPLDAANSYLQHAAVQSAEMLNVYSGNAVLDENGEASIALPPYIAVANTDFRYQLTPIGGAAPSLHIAEEINADQFKIGGGTAGLKVSWQITGVRADPFAAGNPMVVEPAKSIGDQGYYLYPEGYSQPAQDAISRRRRPQ
jgi:hypothetical protein